MEGWRKGNAPPLGPVFKVIEYRVCVCNMSNGIDHYPRPPGTLDPVKVHGAGVWAGAVVLESLVPPPHIAMTQSINFEWTYDRKGFPALSNYISQTAITMSANKATAVHIRALEIRSDRRILQLLMEIWRNVMLQYTDSFKGFDTDDVHVVHFTPRTEYPPIHQFVLTGVDRSTNMRQMVQIDVILPLKGGGRVVDIMVRSMHGRNDPVLKPGVYAPFVGASASQEDPAKKKSMSDFISQVFLRRATGRLNIG